MDLEGRYTIETARGNLALARNRWTGRLVVLHADPQTAITDELLTEITTPGHHHPDVSLNGDVLTIAAENQRVIYRIGKYEDAPNWHLMEWPD